MLKKSKSRIPLLLTLMVLLLNLFPSLISANNVNETNPETQGLLTEKNYSALEDLSAQEDPQFSDEPDKENSSMTPAQQITQLEEQTTYQNNRLESLGHELTVIRMKALKLGKTNLAKEIEQFENDLVIEKMKIIQQSKVSPNKSLNEPLIQAVHTLENTNTRLSNLEHQYDDLISKYENQLNPSVKLLSRSASLARIGNEQSITAGSDAEVSIKKETKVSIVDIKIVDEEGSILSAQQLDHATDTPAFLWHTPTMTKPGTYTIKFEYPENDLAADQFTVHINSVPQSEIIKMNSPLDVELRGNYKVYQFTPSKSQSYSIRTSPTTGDNKTSKGYLAGNDTWLGVYEDSELTKPVRSNEDSDGLYSEVITELKADTAYYVALQGSSPNAFNVNLTVSAYQPTSIYKDSPLDVNVPTDGMIFAFCAPSTGSYSIQTSPYGSNDGRGSDTALWLYADINLYQELAFNDEADNIPNTFNSKIIWNMTQGTCYYIKLHSAGDWLGQTIQSRISVKSISNIEVDDIEINKPIDVSDMSAVYKFTAKESTYYTVFTGFYGRGTQPSDTLLYLYDDEYLNHQIGYNDDVRVDGLYNFSSITYPMHAGKTYYIVLKGYGGYPVYSRITLIFGGQDLYEVNNSDDSAYPIVSNRVYKGLIARSDWDETYGESDTFNFLSQKDGVSHISLRIPQGNVYTFRIMEDGKAIVNLNNVENLVETSFHTKKGKIYSILILSYAPEPDYNKFYTFRITQGQNVSYVYTTSGRLVTQSYELGLFNYEIKYIYDKNGNLTSSNVTKTEILN